MKVAIPVAKNLLAPLAAAAFDAGIQKKNNNNTWFRDNNSNNFK